MRQRSVSANTIIVVGGQSLSLLTTLLLTPIQLSGMGLADYGLLTLVISVVGLATVLDFGLGWAALHLMPQTLRLEDSRMLARRVLAVGAVLGTAAATVPAIVVPLVAPGTPVSVVILGALLVPATVMVNCLYSLIRSTGDFMRSTVIATITVVSSNTVWAIFADNSQAVQIVIAWLLGMSLMGSVYLWFRIFTTRPAHLDAAVELPPLTASVARVTDTRRLLKFSATSALLGVSTVLATTADKVVMGAAVGIAALPLYSVSVGLAARITIFSSSLAGVVFPRLSESEGSGDGESARALAGKVLIVTAALSSTLAGSMALAGPAFFSVWISPEFSSSTEWIIRPLAVAFALYGVGQLGYAANDAKGKVGRSSRTNLSVIIPTLGLMFIVASSHGVTAGSFVFAIGLSTIGLLGIRLGGSGRLLIQRSSLALSFAPVAAAIAIWSIVSVVAPTPTAQLVSFGLTILPVVTWQLFVLRRQMMNQ